MKNRFATLIFLSILFISTFYKISDVWGNNTAFTIDQGRDMVDIRHMVATRTPRLVGPTTSINGVLLGPFWYYFNLPPFIISGGNPMAIVIWQIIWYQLSAILFWLYLRRKSLSLSLAFSIFYLLMPIGFNTARYFWNANAMPFFTALYFLSLFITLSKPGDRSLLLLGIVSGLSMQVEAAFGVIFFPYAFLCVLLRDKNIRKLASLTLGFGITLLPQIAFEFRHGFLMTKIFISEFQGGSNMLGEKLSLPERINDRLPQLIGLVRDSNHLPENLVFFIYLSIVPTIALFLLKNKIPKSVIPTLYTALGFILFTSVFYILFPQKLKHWYTLGFSVPLIILLSVFTSLLLSSKNKIILSLGVAILIGTGFHAIKAQNFYLNIIKTPSTDPSNLKNQLSDIDLIYSQANGNPFAVYSYLPSVYDYPYHYLFWWYGTKKYGYQPYDVAYLPSQPEYIKDNSVLWKKTKQNDGKDLTFLLIENDPDAPQREKLWQNNFSKLCLTQETRLPWRSTIQEREKCSQ